MTMKLLKSPGGDGPKMNPIEVAATQVTGMSSQPSSKAPGKRRGVPLAVNNFDQGATPQHAG